MRERALESESKSVSVSVVRELCIAVAEVMHGGKEEKRG